jgi:hypothetical protein
VSKNSCPHCGYYRDALASICLRCDDLTVEEIAVAKFISVHGGTWDTDGTITTGAATLVQLVKEFPHEQ